MSLPVVVRTQSQGPPPLTIARDIGLYVSVPLLAVALLGTAFVLQARHNLRWLRARGARLGEGRVIVDATRVAPGLLQTQGGENLSIDAAAPLALDVGQRGCVLGDLVREEAHPVGHDTAYRAPDRPHVGRLLPVSDRYDLVRETLASDSDVVRGALIVTAPFAAMTGLALLEDAVSVVEGFADLVEILWLVIACIGVVLLLVSALTVHVDYTMSYKFVTSPRRERRARERRAGHRD
jgi:hypothetical protein